LAKQNTTPSKPGPDFRAIDTSGCKRQDFPVAMSDEYRVHIDESAYDKIKQHAATTDEVELCGVLVGDVFQDGQGVFLRITGAIEGEGANNYGSQVTFTHQTWDHINAVKDKDYPDASIVGWYHTHPGFGVFLSGMDSFIQENFFNQPHHVAIVLETKQHIEGCFAWVNGESKPLRRYWVGNREVSLATGDVEPFDAGTPIADDSEPDPYRESGYAPSYARPPATLWLLVVLAGLGGFLVGQLSMWTRIERALQSEFYSLLEFTTVNTAAATDLATVGDRLAEITGNAPESVPAKTIDELAQLKNLVDSYEQDYRSRDRSALRRDLQELAERRKNLGERMRDLKGDQEQLGDAVASLYVLRLTEHLARLKPDDIRKLSPEELRVLKSYLDQVLKLSPRQKTVIQQMFPELVELLYPSKHQRDAPSPKDTSNESKR